MIKNSSRNEDSADTRLHFDSSSKNRRVTLYHGEGCHLCELAIEVVRDAQAMMPFSLELVDIGGDAALEAAYREFLPVIEIDGVRAFTYVVTVEGLLARLRDDGSPER